MTETLKPGDKAILRRFLIDRFDLNDLKDLAFDLGVDFQLFSHQTKREFVRELITYFEHRATLNCLVMEIMRQRPDNEIANLLSKLPACLPRKAIVIIVSSQDLLESMSDFQEEFASKLQVSINEVVVVGAARGSIHLLVSIPKKATSMQNVTRIHNLGDGKYQVSINLFDSLDSISKRAWRLIAHDYPAIYQEDKLRPAIVWQDVLEELTSETPSTVPRFSSEQLHRMDPLTVLGDLNSIEKLVNYAVSAAAQAGLNHKATYCLRLAVDEIATNIIIHGYQAAGASGWLTITAVFQPDQLIIELKDNSQPFDPRQAAPPKNLKYPLQKRKVGNLGVFLAMWGIDGFQYDHDQGANRSTFIMNRISQKAN